MKQSLARRMLTFFLSLMICFTSLQMPVFAADDTAEAPSSASAEADVSLLLNDAGQKYLVTIEDTTTGDIITNVVLPVGQSRDDLEAAFRENLNPDFQLVDIEEYNDEEADGEDSDSPSDGSEIQPRVVETLFDIGCLVISASEFYNNPSVWNGMFVVFDGASVVLPFIPSVSGIVRLIKGSGNLQESLTYGIKTYRELRKESSITRHAHHIMPKKFKDLFGLTENNMFCINIKRELHDIVTSKQKMAAYGIHQSASNYSPQFVRQQMEKIYLDAYDETGDEIFLFMARFIAQCREYGVR